VKLSTVNAKKNPSSAKCPPEPAIATLEMFAVPLWKPKNCIAGLCGTPIVRAMPSTVTVTIDPIRKLVSNPNAATGSSNCTCRGETATSAGRMESRNAPSNPPEASITSPGKNVCGRTAAE